jgi:hypothetical protein
MKLRHSLKRVYPTLVTNAVVAPAGPSPAELARNAVIGVLVDDRANVAALFDAATAAGIGSMSTPKSTSARMLCVTPASQRVRWRNRS